MNIEPANSIFKNLRDILYGKVNLAITSKQKKSLIVLIVSIVGLVSGLVLVQRVQEIREKAFVGGPDLFFVTTPLSVAPGSTGNVYDIYMNTKGFEVTAAVIEVQFDTNMIQITSIAKSDSLSDVLVSGTVSGNRANITLGSGPTTPFNGTGKVATLTFTAVAQSGQTDIAFTQKTQVAAVGQPGDVLGTTSPGRVIIGDEPVVGGPDLYFPASPLSVAPGNTGNVYEIFMNTNSLEVTAAVIEIQFDTNMIQITSISKGTALSDILVPGTVAGNTASITLGSGPSTPFKGTDKVATLTFTAVAQSGQTDIAFTQKTQVAAVGQPGDVLGTTSPGRVIISFSSPTPIPTQTPSPTPTTNPTVPPPPSTDAIAHWKFDEGSGFNAIDSSGNNNTGTIRGATWTSFGRFNNALVFENGVGDEVLVNTNLMSPLAGTISAWVLAEEFEPEPQYIFGHTTIPPFANRLQIYTDDTSGQLDIGVGDNHSAATNVFDLNVNQWYHVALTWGSGTFKVYVNGTLVHAGSYSGLTTLDPKAAIGNARPGHPTQSWNGTIDEINIFNRELTAGKITALAIGGTGSPSPSPTGPTPTSSPLTGDTNTDGIVNILDFQILSNNFGSGDPSSDINNDGTVNILDFQILSNNFGNK